MALRLIQFLAIMLTALALVPGGTHLAALPNKMAMAQAAYSIAQQIYAGWALFGIVLFGALRGSAIGSPCRRRDMICWSGFAPWSSMSTRSARPRPVWRRH